MFYRTIQIISVLFFCFLLGCATGRKLASDTSDPYQWMEEVESERAIDWVKKHSEPTQKHWQSSADFASVRGQVEKIVMAKDRIAYPSMMGEYIYNFWTDAKNPRGLWRRTSLGEYRTKEPKWETVLDIDLLGRLEKESWVYHGASCLAPAYERCLVSLSRGGKDASELREFDTKTKTFIKDGFYLPEAKSRYSWLDENTLLVATDFGSGSLTKSGYPRILKVWQRGTPLGEAKEIFAGSEADISVSPAVYQRKDGTLVLVTRALNFYEAQYFVRAPSGDLIRLPLPAKASIQEYARGQLFVSLEEPWRINGETFPVGTVVAFAVPKTYAEAESLRPQIVFSPTERISFVSLTATAGKLFLVLSENVKTKVYDLDPQSFAQRPIALPENGDAGLAAASAFRDDVFLSYENFIVPPSLYFLAGVAGNYQPERWKSVPERFRASDLEVKQYFSTSKDGTQVPYFVVHKKAIRLNGKNPTLLYAYGGFQVPMNPYYLNSTGKVWLEKGGVYVLANIRGGGEFGPPWHQAALKLNRQRAFDDFYSVAEDIANRKITSPRYLAIRGGSNGGLLMGVAYTQRPELFRAVICEVPLLDMLRYHKLLAGNSWMAEYGNPDIAEERDYLAGYSPYHNVQKGKNYPSIFFVTSTKDDRVHPAHARKMAARLEENQIPFYYFENIEGGHGAAADLKQRINLATMAFMYMFEQIGKPGASANH